MNRRHSSLPLWLILGGLLVLPALAQGARYGAGTLLCRFQDSRIAESSGLAAGPAANYFFTHNDSGDNARVYAVSRTGATLAMIRVMGAQSMDWEDMARGPGAGGVPSLYLADIGDNERKRAQLSVYVIPEPAIDAARTGQTLETAPAVRYDFTYEGGPRDAEALLIHPRTGQLYVVTKTAPTCAVFTASLPLRADEPNRLRKVGQVEMGSLPARPHSFRDLLLSRLVTGGAFAPDGKRLVLRTYTDAYEWDVAGEDMAATFKQKPVHVPLPRTEQGEAITYTADGRALLVSSEGKNAPVHEVPGQR